MMSKETMRKRVQRLTGQKARPPDWLTCYEAAVYCNVSLGTFRDRIMENVTCKRLGRRIMVERTSLDRFYDDLEAHEAKPRPRRKKKAAAKG